MAYSFYEHRRREKESGEEPSGPFNILFKGILLRYLRLVIPFIPTFLISVSLAFWAQDTSFYWSVDKIAENCQKYWWRNFLFINNLYPFSEMCISWSWYLSADFQCFIASLMLLVLSMKFPKTAFGLFVGIFIGCCAFSGILGWQDEFSFLLDVQFNTVDTLYYPTWVRIGEQKINNSIRKELMLNF